MYFWVDYSCKSRNTLDARYLKPFFTGEGRFQLIEENEDVDIDSAKYSQHAHT